MGASSLFLPIFRLFFLNTATIYTIVIKITSFLFCLKISLLQRLNHNQIAFRLIIVTSWRLYLFNNIGIQFFNYPLAFWFPFSTLIHHFPNNRLDLFDVLFIHIAELHCTEVFYSFFMLYIRLHLYPSLFFSFFLYHFTFVVRM